MVNYQDPIKVKIDPKSLEWYIRHNDLSVAAIAREGRITEYALRKGLRDAELSYIHVAYLSYRLKVDAYKFAYVSTYLRKLYHFMCGGYDSYLPAPKTVKKDDPFDALEEVE